MNHDALRGVALSRVVRALIVLSAIILCEMLGVIVVLSLGIEVESLLGLIIPELAGAAAAVGGMALLGGTSPLKPAREDIAYAFRFGWWSIAIGLGLFFIELWGYLSDTPLHADWVRRTLECGLFCLAVGVLEECMFRGVLFNSLLALFGGTHRGVVRSVIVTSILFGMAHIDVSEVEDAITGAQAILKIVQTGMYSVLLCVIMLRTRKLVGVSLFHAVDDFLILAPSIGLFGETPNTDYVVSGDEAAVTILFYVVVINLYLPFLIKSLRELQRGQDVYLGLFMADALEQAEERVARMEQEHGLLPVPPSLSPAQNVTTSLASENACTSGERNDQGLQADTGFASQSENAERPHDGERLGHATQGVSPETLRRGHRPPAPKGLEPKRGKDAPQRP